MNAIGRSDPARLHLRRRRAWRGAYDHGPPISRASSLPLLFFAVCLIAALAAFNGRSSHVILVELPPPNAVPDIRAERVSDRLTIDRAGNTRWNGVPVSRQDLWTILTAAGANPNFAHIEFEPDKATLYGDAFAVLGLIWRTGLASDQLCFRGLDRLRTFDAPRDDRADVPSLPCDVPPPLY